MQSGLLHFYTQPTNGIEELLLNTTLGSNGALYQLLDTPAKIHSLDNPLFLTVERGTKTLANVTFCRRNEHWYIRYFAFDSAMQSKGNKKSKSSSGILTNELNSFFDTTLKEGFEGKNIRSFYAYIDPKNTKSVWMSEKFGFHKVGEKATQTFSRAFPKKKIYRVTHLNLIT